MTFERIFTDPRGDLARVQEALTRPECQLTENSERNWQLNETRHAAAFHNTALIMWFCYDEGVHHGDGVGWGRRIPPSSSELAHSDHTMWTHALEYHWVKEKCKSLDLKTDPQSPVYAGLRKLLAPLFNDTEQTERFANEELLLSLFAENPAKDGKTFVCDHEALV